MTHILDLLAGGIVAGALVALLALGISLIYKTTGVLNLSQGAFAALGAYVCYSASRLMPMLPAVLVAMVITAILGAITGLALRNTTSKTSTVVPVVATLALAIAIGQIVQQVWGTTPVFFPNEIGIAPVRLDGIDINRVNLYGFVTTAALVLLLTGFLRFTRVGLTLRAVAESRRGARLCGVSTVTMNMIAWAIASGLASVSGFFIASSTGLLSPDTLDLYLVASLIAAVIGGLGSLPGALAGAVLIWTAQSFFGAYAPSLSLGTSLVPLAGFGNTFLLALLILVLLLAPRGVLGGGRTQRV